MYIHVYKQKEGGVCWDGVGVQLSCWHLLGQSVPVIQKTLEQQFDALSSI